MKLPEELIKIRDEAAFQYTQTHYPNEINLVRIEAFRLGFEAAYEYMNAEAIDYQAKIVKALAKIKTKALFAVDDDMNILIDKALELSAKYNNGDK